MSTDTPPNLEARFDRGSWIALAYALVIFVYSATEIVYGLSLPYDGWVITWGPDSADAAIEVQFEFNGQDQPSALRRGDLLIAVDGKPVTQIYAESLTLSHLQPPHWPDGHLLHYTVRRGGEQRTVAVPVHSYSLLEYQAGWLRRDNASHLAQVISSLLFFGIGAFVFFRRPREPAAHALLLIGTGFFFQWLSTPASDSVTHLFEPFTSVVFRVFNYWTNAIVPSLAYLILAFPTPKWPLRLFPRLTLALLYLPYTPAAILGYLLLRQDPVAFQQALFHVNVSPLIWIPPALLMLIHSIFTVREPLARAQMKWLAFGLGGFILIGISAWLVDFVVRPEGTLGFIVRLGSSLGWLMLPICLAIAILRYRLFDIDVIINRALVYLVLTAGVIGVYVLMVSSLGRLVHTQDNLVLSLMATSLVAVLFAPARDVVQRSVNRLMYGERDEPYRLLTRLGQQLESTLEPSTALARTVETVAKALKLPYVAITLQKEESQQSIAVYGSSLATVSRYPLLYAGEPIGELVAAARTPNEALTPADERLLRDLARQIGVAAHAAQLTTALQRSRTRLVTAREEERRRIRRDLHDGLGPALANVTMRLEQARESLPPGAGEADAILAQLTVQTQTTITDIRRLVYELRPPDLDEYGLVSALREYLHRMQPRGITITLAAPEALPALPAAVEVAAYRIVQEAVNNAVKHAKASAITVTLAIQQGASMPSSLQVEICDNGVGLPLDHTVGIGLHSMRERAEELGGTLTIQSNEMSSTRVVAQLPIG